MIAEPKFQFLYKLWYNGFAVAMDTLEWWHILVAIDNRLCLQVQSETVHRVLMSVYLILLYYEYKGGGRDREGEREGEGEI